MPSPCTSSLSRDVCSGTDQQNSKEVDGAAYEVDCTSVVIKPGADVDIGAF